MFHSVATNTVMESFTLENESEREKERGGIESESERERERQGERWRK